MLVWGRQEQPRHVGIGGLLVRVVESVVLTRQFPPFISHRHELELSNNFYCSTPYLRVLDNATTKGMRFTCDFSCDSVVMMLGIEH